MKLRRFGGATRWVVAGSAALIALAAGIGPVSAYTVPGATFVPDHATPGARVVVMGLPLAVDCPDADVWLIPGSDPSPPVDSSVDPRLIKLAGRVRSAPIGIGIGDTRPATEFVFPVPDLAPGAYGTFAACRGSQSGYGDLGPGATTFRVDPHPPNTDTASVAGSASTATPAPEWTAMTSILAGVLAFAIVGRTLHDRRRR